jgi:hypothetical protein
MKVFEELGAAIEKLWRDANYDEEVFPVLAEKALQEADLPKKVSAWEVIEWTLGETNLPEQKDLPGNFGDPPITIYNAPRFHVDVYFWLEGTTSVHQHAFCGAFQVLHGSSIHSWFDFEPTARINVFTEIGEMSLKVCEILEVGDIQKIFAGRRYIHSLFHLEQPSATIVVRTHKSPMYLPQYSYHKPNLAIDPFFEEANTTKKLQAITALIRSEHPETDRFVTEFLERSDFQTSFQIIATMRAYLQQNRMQEMFNLSSPKERLNKLLEIVGRRHERFADVLPKVFAHHDKLDQIVRLRGYVKDAEQRFFLALLLNVEGRERIFDLIKTKFPDAEPLDKVLDWVYDLSRTRVMGMNNSNALGVENFDDFDLMVLENLLQDKSDAATIEAIKADLPPENAETLDENIRQRIEKIKAAVIFQPLLKSER